MFWIERKCSPLRYYPSHACGELLACTRLRAQYHRSANGK